MTALRRRHLVAPPFVLVLVGAVGLAAAWYAERSHVDAYLRAAPAATTTVTLAYGTHARQTMDVTYTSTASGRPCVFLVAGGTWEGGDKSSIADTAAKWAGGGFVAVNVDYRRSYPPSSGSRWPAQRDDVGAAVRAFRDVASKYGASGRCITYGFSSGGHVAAAAGLAGTNTLGLRGIVSVSGTLQPDRWMSETFAGTGSETHHKFYGRTAAVTGCGIPDWEQCARQWISFRPDHSLNSGDAPLYLLQGTADTVVPPATASSFAYWAKQAGVGCTVVSVSGVGHDEHALVLGSAGRWGALVSWAKARTA